MGRNAAFGRQSPPERLRQWWDERDRTARQNVVLALGVGALFVAIILAAVNRDPSPTSSRVISSRPQATTTTLGFTPSTVFVGNLGAAGTATAADLPGASTTTPTTTSAPAPSVAASPTTRPAPAPAPAITAAPAPAPVTTVTNPNVIYTDVPVATTTTRPPTTTTRAPTTTVAPTTTTTALALPVNLPLLAP